MHNALAVHAEIRPANRRAAQRGRRLSDLARALGVSYVTIGPARRESRMRWNQSNYLQLVCVASLVLSR